MRSRWLVALWLAVLAGCGSGPIENSTTTSARVVGDVALTISGGIAGSTTTVTVKRDGVVTVVGDVGGSNQSVLPEPELSALHSMVASPEFGALDETYVPPEGVCCDFFYYEITADIGDETIKSATADTVETPLILQQVIDLLSGLTT